MAGLPRALPAWIAPPVFFGVALALYLSGLRNPLMFDDGHLQEWALRERYADAYLRFASRWVSDTTFSWVYSAFGYSIPAQRVFNMVAHAAAASALFVFATRLGTLVAQEARARWLALAGALVFVVHPVAVYAVGYLIQRSIVLATLFSVLALLCVLEALAAQSRRSAAGWYAEIGRAHV